MLIASAVPASPDGSYVRLASRFLTLEPEKEHRIDFRILDGFSISGTVMDQYGRAVPAAKVWLTESPWVGGPWPVPNTVIAGTVTDAAGNLGGGMWFMKNR